MQKNSNKELLIFVLCFVFVIAVLGLIELGKMLIDLGNQYSLWSFSTGVDDLKDV
jgi:prefoldin subunit 5